MDPQTPTSDCRLTAYSATTSDDVVIPIPSSDHETGSREPGCWSRGCQWIQRMKETRLWKVLIFVWTAIGFLVSAYKITQFVMSL